MNYLATIHSDQGIQHQGQLEEAHVSQSISRKNRPYGYAHIRWAHFKCAFSIWYESYLNKLDYQAIGSNKFEVVCK